MSNEHLFVYGTLRRDSQSEMYHLLARYAEFVAEATWQGKLYLVDYYPGVIPSNDPSDLVHGEVYRLDNPRIVLEKLDAYEECSPAYPEPRTYVRRKEKVTVADGDIVDAWVYVFNRPISGLKRIESGDFLTIKVAGA